MRIEKGLQTLLQLVCNLLGSGSACLLLTRSDPFFRHPLLAFLPADLSLFAHDPSLDLAFLQDERLLALMDLALARGDLSCYDFLPDSIYSSIALAPLAVSSGQLGLLLLADTRPQAFLSGEQLLLSQFSPFVARQVEYLLSDLCLSSTSSYVSFSSEQELGTFLSLMNHEIRLPLTAIKGYVALLQTYGSASAFSDDASLSSPASPPPLSLALQHQYLQVVLDQVNHLELLLGDLLDISRLHYGRLAFRQLPVDVRQLCQHVISFMQHQMAQQQPGRYRFSCHCAPVPLIALADPARLQQVLLNLLENAVKYSPAGGPVELFVSKQNSSSPTGSAMICVTVRDRGIGIPLSQQPLLFRPFSRGTQSSSLNLPGSGLGLYISRLLIEAMGGTITLQSSEGLGARLTFFLPAMTE